MASHPPSKPQGFNGWQLYRNLFNVPWWAVILVMLGISVAISIASNPDYALAFSQLAAAMKQDTPESAAYIALAEPIKLTLVIGIGSYFLALAIGLIVGLIRSNPPKPASTVGGIVPSIIRAAVYHLSTVYVEIIRGIPMFTFLLLAAFVLIPYIRNEVLAPYGITLPFRSTSYEVGIIGLALAYGAFMSETFRAGIQSIEKGQVEASRALGLNFFQLMRFVVLPQAIRRILPPLGNDLISMLKDSAMVGSILAVREITQTANVIAGSNFKYQPYLITAAVIYLFLTISLSLIVKWVERRMKMHTR